MQGTTLSWAGPLPVGATAVVTYSVTVGEGPRATLRNVVVAPAGSGGTCWSGSEDDDCRTVTAVTPTPPGLASTGVALPLAATIAGLALLVMGAVLLVARRRRRSA